MEWLVLFIVLQLVIAFLFDLLVRRRLRVRIGSVLANIVFAATCALAFYTTVLIEVNVIDLLLVARLDTFDLNHDGFFSFTETNHEQQEAYRRVVSDQARALAPITGAFFSCLYFLTILIAFGILSLMRKILPRRA